MGVTQRCLTLEQREAAPASDRDYAFWSSSDCSRRLQYVCETPRDWTGERTGEDATGTEQLGGLGRRGKASRPDRQDIPGLDRPEDALRLDAGQVPVTQGLDRDAPKIPGHRN